MTIRVIIPWTITWRSLARHDAYWYKGKHMWKMLQIGSIGWLCRLYGAYTKNSKTFTATAQLVGCQRRCHNNSNIYNNLSTMFCHARCKRTLCHVVKLSNQYHAIFVTHVKQNRCDGQNKKFLRIQNCITMIWSDNFTILPITAILLYMRDKNCVVLIG